MHTRGLTKRMEKEQETQEDRRDEEAEVVTDTEMEQQASNKDVYKRQKCKFLDFQSYKQKIV